jgi:hypothetical protein
MAVTTNADYVGKVLTKEIYQYLGDGDGYFYVIAWNNEKNGPEHVFVRHAGYSSTHTYVIDATEEVVNKYNAYMQQLKYEADKREQKNRVMDKLENRKRWMKVSKELNIPYPVVMKKLKNNKDILILLETKVRSEFKMSLKNQVITWLNEASPKYNFPLSPRQLSFIAPRQYW